MPEHYSGPYPRPVSVVTSGPDERVSEAERQAVVEQLRLNAQAGRLEVDEFGQRVETALAARTGSDLTPLLVDIPHVNPPLLPMNRRRRMARTLLAAYLVVEVLLVAFWGVTGWGTASLVAMVAWSFVIVCVLAGVASFDPDSQ